MGYRTASCIKVVLAALVLAGAPAVCRAELRLGGVRINPFAELRTRYTSNVYRDDARPAPSIVTPLKPGVLCSLDAGTHEFRAGGWAEVINYSENPSVNNTLNSNAEASALLRFPVGLTADARFAFDRTTDEPNSEIVERIRRSQVTAASRLSYRVNRSLSASVIYTRYRHAYDPDDYRVDLDRTESNLDLEVAAAVSSRLTVLLGYGGGTIGYEYSADLKDSEHRQLYAGFRGRLTPKTTGEVRFGEKKRTSAGAGGESMTPVAVVSVATEFSDLTSLAVTGGRDFEESEFLNNRYFETNILSATLKHKMHRNWSSAVTAGLDVNDYPEVSTLGGVTQKRRDRRYQAELALEYATALRWLSLGWSYAFTHRESNFGPYTYTDHVSEVFTRITF